MRATSTVRLAIALAVFATGVQAADELVTYAPRTSYAGQPATLSRAIDVNTSLLIDGAPSIRLQLPDGTVATAILDDLERRTFGDLTWRGRLDGMPESRVVLTLKNGFVSGRIVSPEGLYEIQPRAGASHVFEKLDPGRFAPCQQIHPDVGVPNEPVQVPDALGADEPDQITLMVLYTPQARSAAGGVAQIEAIAQGAVDNSNTAFIDSDMIARFTIVHTGESTRNDFGDMEGDLDWLRTNSGVAALRDQHAADMVSLLVGNGSYCGLGYVMRDPGPGFEDFAFQVTHWTCAVGNLSFAHEHGHNMGFEHDPANGTSPNFASYPWSFGHFVNGSYRTVMSYSSECTLGCTRVPHFSNPAINEFGAPTGIAGSRDNARSGDLTAPIIANFRTSPTRTLTVDVVGSGNGTVTSSPSGIDCGSDCAEDYPSGESVTLTPTPDPGSIFSGWSGPADCSDGSVTMSANLSCTATFDQLHTLTISKDGSGTGTVTSSPAGIDCGSDCAEDYFAGESVTLTATPGPSSTFSGWSGPADCSDGTVTMNADVSCTATFTLQYRLTVSKSGNGTGTVQSTPAGINCGADCSQDYLVGQAVTLTATPSFDSNFNGWSGPADCADGSVTMNSNLSCTATFALRPKYDLTVAKTGAGTGTVTSSPGGIDCGADCSELLFEGTSVVLYGTPAIGSEISEWTGHADCRDGLVTMHAPRACTALFRTCTDSGELYFESELVAGAEVAEACNYAYVGPSVEVMPTGQLDIYAGNAVTFYNGFQVEAGGQLSVFVGQPAPAP